MANITPTISGVPQVQLLGDIALQKWEAMLDTDVGLVSSPGYGEFPEKSVQVAGTWGAGGELTLQGTIDGTNFSTLDDKDGNPIVLTADGFRSIRDAVVAIRPSVTGGDGSTDLDVTVFHRRHG